MAEKISPFLEGKYGWPYGSNGWNGGMDENLVKFSYMFDRNVDGIVSSLPSAVNGTAYFNTVDNRFYFVVDGTYYSSPCPKWFVFTIRSTGEQYQFDGHSLVLIETQEQLSSRINLLEENLSDTETATKGSALIGRAAVTINSVSEFPSQPLRTDLTYHLRGYRSTSTIGNGTFVYDPTIPKSSHDGGRYFSPTVPWSTTLSNYLNAVGETDPSGSGCFVRQTVSFSPLDFGAVDGGVVDCTFAFVATENAIKEKGGEAKAYVPLGTYLVDTTVIDIGRFYGDGYILTTAGVRIAMQPFRDQTSLVQAKLMVPNFGFDNGTIDTSVYSGARNALQGISIVEVGGVTKLFMSQRVAGGAWTSTTRCRIIECDLVTDGSTVPVVTFSGLLNIGHGIDLTARVEGGEVYLYSSQPVDPAFPNELAGKGYSRIRWRGNATTQADVQSYTLWGQVGSGHQLEKYNRACVKISDDGKWLIMASSPISAGAKRQILVYDFLEVTAAADKLNTRPKIITEYSLPSEQSSNVLQGIMSDGRTLTINMGGTVTLSPNYITDIGFDGTESLLQEYEGALDQYGLSGILNNSTQGHPWRFEPEGICSYKGGRVVSIAEGWYESARIVTWEGLRWACITPSDTTGVPPSNGSYWVRTTKAATDGAWDAGVNYANTSNFSHEVKTIYYVGPSLGLPQERPLTTGINNRPDPSQVPTGQGAGATSAGFQWRNSFTVRAWAAALGRYFDAFWYDNSSRFRIYDAREGSDNTVFASIQALFTSSMKALILRGRGTSSASSALLRLHDRNDPSYPGYIIESTREDGSFSRETNGQGATRFAASSGSTPITACRPDDGMMYGFEKIRGENLWGLYRGQGSPEGNVTAPRGSLYVVSTGATNTLYVKESGSGNTGWVGK